MVANVIEVVKALIKARTLLKKMKMFREADVIRDFIKTSWGVKVIDTKSGERLEVISSEEWKRGGDLIVDRSD